MFHLVGNRANSLRQYRLFAAGLVVLLPLAGCNTQQSSTPAQTGPQTFSSLGDAGTALENAAKTQDQNALQKIFGPGSSNVLFSGDATEDKVALGGFAQAYQVMNRWKKLGDGSELLLVGADNQAFPIPLMKNANGQWYFDTAAGKEEILSRRIGYDEITAIGVCDALASAQSQYFSQRHGGVKQYAQKFISDNGQANGLYWPEANGVPRSPLGPLVAYATSEGYKADPGRHQPFNGYYFAMLSGRGPNATGGQKNYISNGKMTGGFAAIAYPAAYGDSGIMTFLVNQNGLILQKDLGSSTTQIASAMTDFNPDGTWTVVQ